MQKRHGSRNCAVVALFFGLLAVGCGAEQRPLAGPREARDAPPPEIEAALLRAEDRRWIDDALREATTHPHEGIRSRAVRALGRIGDAAGRPLLLAALEDSAAAVRTSAVTALALLAADGGDADALLATAGDAAPEVRRAAALAVGRRATPDLAETLLALLDDGDPSVAAAAALGVPRFEVPGFAVDRLLALGRADDTELIICANWALSRLTMRTRRIDFAQTRVVRARMLELAKSPIPEMRQLAATGLTVPTTEDEAVAVGALSADPDPFVRIAAVEALSFPGAPIAPFLSKALLDEDDRVLLAVVEGLGRMRGLDVMEQLARMAVHDPRPWLRVRAVDALGRVAPEAARMAAGLSRSENAAVRRETAELISGRVDDETAPLVRTLAADDDTQVRVAAIPVLAELAGPLGDLLGSAIASDEPAIRVAAADAVARRVSADASTEEVIDEALALLERIWPADEDDVAGRVALASVEAAARAAHRPTARAILERGLVASDWRVRRRAAEHLRELDGEDRSAAIGPAVDRPLADYIEIARWARRPRAAIVTVERPGFVPGRFTFKLDTENAPLAAWQFARLAEAGRLDDAPLDLQPNRALRAEFSADVNYSDSQWIRDEARIEPFWTGSVGLDSPQPDSATGRWFISLGLQPEWGPRHPMIGAVVQNLGGVVAFVLPGDRVVSVEIYDGDGSESLPPLDDEE